MDAFITFCRQSGLFDREWCAANGIFVSGFYNAVVRLRKKTARSRNVNRIRKYDLTAFSLPDVVPISVLPENKTCHAAPALQDAVGAYLLPVDLKME